MPDAREQWLVAGQRLLREHGHAGVKLTPLAAACGLTSGSFYHHFTGMPDFLAELARYYGTEQPTAFVAQLDDPDPLVRLRKIRALSRDESMAPLDAAMRDWAGSNPLAAAAVHDADAILLRFLERAYRDLGCERDDARARAHLTLAVAVARVVPPWPPVPADRYVEVLTRDPDQTRSVGRSGKPRA